MGSARSSQGRRGALQLMHAPRILLAEDNMINIQVGQDGLHSVLARPRTALMPCSVCVCVCLYVCLWVGDDQIAQRFLQWLGLPEAQVVMDGQQAVDAFSLQGPFDLILMDCQVTTIPAATAALCVCQPCCLA
jgi:CheY-like chemotaxis protein